MPTTVWNRKSSFQDARVPVNSNTVAVNSATTLVNGINKSTTNRNDRIPTNFSESLPTPTDWTDQVL